MVHRCSVPRRSRGSSLGTGNQRAQGAGRDRMPHVMRFSWLPHTAVRAVVLVSLFGVPGAACKGGGGGGKQEASKTLRIGVITSLTGAQAAFGKAHKLGYEI